MVAPSDLHWRQSVIDYFSSLVDPQRRAELGPTEAVCEWFDDLYAPADNPARYNPGAFERGLREWQACFSEPELAAMAEYHRYFESIERGFDVDRPWDEIEVDPRWRDLIDAAAKALDVFTQTI